MWKLNLLQHIILHDMYIVHPKKNYSLDADFYRLAIGILRLAMVLVLHDSTLFKKIKSQCGFLS